MTNNETKRHWDKKTQKERVSRFNTQDCLEIDAPTAWSKFNTTLEERVACLATITEGTDAEFIQSLVKRFTETTLSSKQIYWVERLYRDYGNASRGRRIIHLTHKWSEIDEVQHDSNFILGTYSVSTYYKCDKCGLEGESYSYNNYSGD